MRIRFCILLALAFCILGCMVLRLEDGGYLNVSALQRWAVALRDADAVSGGTHALTWGFPYVNAVLLWPFTWVDSLRSVRAPAVLSCLASALFLTVFAMRLRASAVPRLAGMALWLITLLNPFFLWPATSGDSLALALLGYLTFCLALRTAVKVEDARSLMTVAALLAVLWLCDIRSGFLLLALLPLLPLILPEAVLRQSAAAGYLVLLFPAVTALLASAYIGFVTTGEGWSFLHPQHLREIDITDPFAWPLSSGLAAVGAFALLAFPAAFLRNPFRSMHSRSQLIAASLPVLAAVLSALTGNGVFDPFPFLVLLHAPLAVWILEQGVTRPVFTAALATAGTAIAWLLFAFTPSRDAANWTAALLGRPVEYQALEEMNLGLWLRRQSGQILVDDRFFGPAIAARGHARNLLLPAGPDFWLQLSAGTPDAALVITPSPALYPGDHVNLRFPHLHEHGFPGYELVYDQAGWRAWRKAQNSAQVRPQETYSPAATY